MKAQNFGWAYWRNLKTAEEIIKILNKEKNPKHRLLLMLTYSSGLRVSEVVSLKKEHIDLSRQVIFIKQGKGRKDRYTILSEKVFLFIQEYYEHFKIEKWIFPGQSGKNHLSIRSAQLIFDKVARCAGITKKYLSMVCVTLLQLIFYKTELISDSFRIFLVIPVYALQNVTPMLQNEAFLK